MRAPSRLALLVELADTLDLGSSSKECGFESRVGHYNFKEVNSMKQRKCRVVIPSMIYWTVAVGIFASALVLGVLLGWRAFITAVVFCIFEMLCSIAYYVVLRLEKSEDKKPPKDYISKNVYIRPDKEG